MPFHLDQYSAWPVVQLATVCLADSRPTMLTSDERASYTWLICSAFLVVIVLACDSQQFPLDTKQHNLVLVTGQRCPSAGKITIGLSLHCPYITDLSGLSTYGLKGVRSVPHIHSSWGMVLGCSVA